MIEEIDRILSWRRKEAAPGCRARNKKNGFDNRVLRVYESLESDRAFTLFPLSLVIYEHSPTLEYLFIPATFRLLTSYERVLLFYMQASFYSRHLPITDFLRACVIILQA